MPEADVAAAAGELAPLDGTENPPAGRAERAGCGEDGPDGPVTFMRCDSSR
jgi:hypothetical protein